MTVTAWTASHTGLPSIYSDQDKTLTAPDGRILHQQGAGAPFMVSDALAAPGVEGAYTLGSTVVRVSRASSGDRRVGIVAGRDGRSVPGALLVNNEDPTSWKSGVERHETGAVRWPLHPQPVSGESLLLVLDPTLEDKIEQVLRSHAVLYVGPASPTPGVPVRPVVVESVERKRLRLGRLAFTVAWTVADGPARATLTGGVPVVTWGDWEQYRDDSGDLADHSELELAQLIAGMPS